MIRLLMKLMGMLVALVALAIGVAIYSIDSIARRAVEVAGTHVLGTPTTLGGMHIGFVSSKASMNGLAVANPPGYADPEFLTLGDGSIGVDARSLTGDVIRIPSIRLSDIKVVLEQKGDASNAKVILANMKSAFGSGSSSSGSSASGGRRYVIDELLIENIAITAKASGLPILQPTVNLNVKQVRLASLGSAGKDPIGMDQLTAIVVNAIMQAAIEAGGSQLPKQMIDGVLGGLAGLGQGIPNFNLAIDTGGGLKQVGDISQLAGKLGVDLGSLTERFGGDGIKGLGGVGEKLDEAGKSAGDALKKGLGDLLK